MAEVSRAGVDLDGSAVVMPVYNEKATVRDVLDSVRREFAGTVIVVDDGSTDGTAQCIASRTDVFVVRHDSNLGYGASLIDGFAAARRMGLGSAVTMDTDGQHEPKHIAAFLEALGSADIVSGSRYLPDSEVISTAPVGREMVNRRVTKAINRETGWRLTDSFCGFKAYRLAAIEALNLSEPGYGMPVELWAKAWQAGLRVIELPVERIYNDHDRTFGADLDDSERRLAYYGRVWRDALCETAGRAGGGCE